MKGSLCRLAETSFLWRDTAMRIRERFNPRAPCGARREVEEDKKLVERFQPTRPLRGATSEFLTPIEGVPISTHAPLAGRDIKRTGIKTKEKISTHAPLAGRDDIGHLLFFSMDNFNPRAPCGARHRTTPNLRSSIINFNPRAPCGARRVLKSLWGGDENYFNPRAPCGARPIPILL